MVSARFSLLLGIVVLAGIVSFIAPRPEGLTAEAWQLAIIFVATTVCVLSNALPIFVASIAGKRRSWTRLPRRRRWHGSVCRIWVP
jgi:di/tricarboxylate transporter